MLKDYCTVKGVWTLITSRWLVLKNQRALFLATQGARELFISNGMRHTSTHLAYGTDTVTITVLAHG